MMKRLGSLHRTLLGKIILIPVVLIVLLYIVLFTPLGNRLVSPLSEKILTSALSTPVTVHEFALTHSRFHFILQDTHANTLSMQGGFSLLTLRMYAHYRFECFHEGGINPLNADFKTDGALSGGISALDIKGNAEIFGGNVLYQMQLHRFKLGTLYLNLNRIGYESMLHMLDYPSSTDTLLSGEIDLRGFDIRDIQGYVRLRADTRQFAPTIIQENNESFDFKTLLSDEKGKIKPFNVNVTLDTSFDNIGILEQFVGMHLGNSAKINGALQGDEELMHLNLQSDIAQSDSSLKIEIPHLEPSALSMYIRHADVEGLFSLFAMPAPIKGVSDITGEMNMEKGDFRIELKKGSTVPNILISEYQITQPLIRFNADINARLNPQGIHYKGSFTSNLKRIEIDSSTTHEQMLRDLLKSLH